VVGLDFGGGVGAYSAELFGIENGNRRSLIRGLFGSCLVSGVGGGGMGKELRRRAGKTGKKQSRKSA